MRVDATTYADATTRILGWAQAAAGGYVCAANVHMCMEAYDRSHFRSVVNAARLVTPDGMPLVLMLRRMGIAGQPRVYGPDLTLHVLAAAAATGLRVGFYGGSESTLASLLTIYAARFPGLVIAYAYSPPFRPLTVEEDRQVVADINGSDVQVLFVGLGCPKQEMWCADHAAVLPCIQVAVGAAFAFHAGEVAHCPPWLQRLSLEWLYRLCAEPRRLWRRYVWNNPRFMLLAGWQLLTRRGTGGPGQG